MVSKRNLRQLVILTTIKVFFLGGKESIPLLHLSYLYGKMLTEGLKLRTDKLVFDGVEYNVEDENESLQYMLLLFSRYPSLIESAIRANVVLFKSIMADLDITRKSHMLAQRCLSDAIEFAVEPSVRDNDVMLEEIHRRFEEYTGACFPETDSEKKYVKKLKKRG